MLVTAPFIASCHLSKALRTAKLLSLITDTDQSAKSRSPETFNCLPRNGTGIELIVEPGSAAVLIMKECKASPPITLSASPVILAFGQNTVTLKRLERAPPAASALLKSSILIVMRLCSYYFVEINTAAYSNEVQCDIVN